MVVEYQRTHTILEMTPAAKIDLFSALTNPCDLTRLTTLLLLLIALLANVAVSFISRYLVDVREFKKRGRQQ